MHNFVVYKSSAGSGKTFTLVKEYLRLALCDERKLYSNYRKILAITFTNKAAAEMKQRVIDALNDIALQEAKLFTGELLCEELRIGYPELKKRAKIVLSAILHHYSDFSIGTIDSFTHKIVKTFAHDLKLPVNFNIELDTQGFYEKVIAALLSQIGEDEYVSKLLKEYALTRAEDNASWDPERRIQEFSKLLQKENSGEYIGKLQKFDASQLEAFRKQFADFSKHYKTTLKQMASEAIALISEYGLTDEDFIFKKTGPQSFFRKCLANSVSLADIDGARISAAVTSGKWSGNGSPGKDGILKQITPQLTASAIALINFIRENYSYYSLCELLSRQMYPLMLLKKIEEICLEQKQEERLVFISEFNQKIFDIINNEPAPFIYERLGERYQHYLLDEFQDTSSLQWQNILPLLDNSLGNGWFNLVVGDGKQSIYRWRNANVKQFAALPVVENLLHNKLTAERAASLQRNFGERLLATNFRSLKTIIEFNNALFESLSGKLLGEGHKKIYAGQQQRISNQATGYITIHTNKTAREELDEHTCDILNKHIEKALAAGFSFKDICVLVRKNSQGNTVADYLVERQIPVVSSDSLLLRNNLEVNTLLNYLRYLLNRKDVISAASVINYLFQTRQLSEDEFHLALEKLSSNQQLSAILKSHNIHLPENDLALHNLLDSCIGIINALGLNHTAYHYMRFFLDEINEFLVTKNSGMSAFFEWWNGRSKRASMIIPENTDAVRIMTIHASKGLEFPVVIVPFCNWGIYQADESWVNVQSEKVGLPVSVIQLSSRVADSGFEKELEAERQEQVLDNLNLLYVAFTRAVERLHIISSSATSNNIKSIRDWIEEFLLANHHTVQEGFYEIGEPLPKLAPARSSRLKTMPLLPLAFNISEGSIRIRASYQNSSSEAAIQQGLLIHWLLSKIRTVADISSAIEKALMEGLISHDQTAVLRELLFSVVTHSKLKKYFGEGVDCRLEAEIATSGAVILRPDRIVFTSFETTIIDYKTGKENEKYFRQLLNYEQALHQMGYTNIKKLLLYTDALKVVEVK
jgi:ATP-dependent exoDNAse (exonuclease V) beta subunit